MAATAPKLRRLKELDGALAKALEKASAGAVTEKGVRKVYKLTYAQPAKTEAETRVLLAFVKQKEPEQKREAAASWSLDCVWASSSKALRVSCDAWAQDYVFVGVHFQRLLPEDGVLGREVEESVLRIAADFLLHPDLPGPEAVELKVPASSDAEVLAFRQELQKRLPGKQVSVVVKPEEEDMGRSVLEGRRAERAFVFDHRVLETDLEEAKKQVAAEDRKKAEIPGLKKGFLSGGRALKDTRSDAKPEAAPGAGPGAAPGAGPGSGMAPAAAARIEALQAKMAQDGILPVAGASDLGPDQALPSFDALVAQQRSKVDAEMDQTRKAPKAVAVPKEAPTPKPEPKPKVKYVLRGGKMVVDTAPSSPSKTSPPPSPPKVLSPNAAGSARAAVAAKADAAAESDALIERWLKQRL